MIRDPAAAGAMAPVRAPWILRGHRAPAGWYSSIIGWSARRSIPKPLRRPLYRAFSRAVGASVEEADRDLSDYASFGDFFARRLRPGLRPLDADAAFIAP